MLAVGSYLWEGDMTFYLTPEFLCPALTISQGLWVESFWSLQIMKVFNEEMNKDINGDDPEDSTAIFS